jgi:HAD superfamily hydrolase (TIGR01490 family)
MSRVGAFFDLDRTLVACNTGRLFLKDLRRRGEISVGRALRALGWLARYHFSLLDVDAMAENIMGGMRGCSERDFEERCRRWVEDEVLPRLLPAGLRKIEEHRQQGHLLAILSTSPSYVTRPIARTLGMDEVLSTQFEVEGGLFTGRVIAPACFGSGKVHWAEKLGRSHSIDLGRSWFYTDSFTDLPMLERVGNRVVVNPDPRLRRAARQRGWAVENWVDEEAAA